MIRAGRAIARSRRAVVLLVLAAAAPAAAQTPAKLLCVPETVTFCPQAKDCETTPATEAQKRSPIVIDFAGKQILSRRDGDDSPIGQIVEDRMEGDKRLIEVRRMPPNQDRPGMRVLFEPGGRAEGTIHDGTGGFIAACTPA